MHSLSCKMTYRRFLELDFAIESFESAEFTYSQEVEESRILQNDL